MDLPLLGISHKYVASCVTWLFLMEGHVRVGKPESMMEEEQRVSELGECTAVRGSLQGPSIGQKGEAWWGKPTGPPPFLISKVRPKCLA